MCKKGEIVKVLPSLVSFDSGPTEMIKRPLFITAWIIKFCPKIGGDHSLRR